MGSDPIETRPHRNPFTPGAGAYPPELAGRAAVLEDGRVLAGRMLLGRYKKGLMLIGLRGVGKTVLLKNMAESARLAGAVPIIVEVRNSADDMEELSLRIKDVRGGDATGRKNMIKYRA